MADSDSLDSGHTLPRSQAATPTPGSTAVPQGDARYEVISVLGEGGMGRVVEAIDKQFSRVVAIKELRGAGGDSARLQTEAVVTGNLEHPGVPAVYERGVRADGAPFYVMRRVRGRALEDVLAEAKDLPGRLAQLPALTRAAQTLGFAHEKGVVHRDVKPQNIMVGGHGEVFVVDWGLARAGSLSSSVSSSDGTESAAPQKTMAGAVMGTPAYMAPEQARGDGAMVDARTDVFALGAVLYRMLAGRPPYDGSSTAAVLELARRGEYPSLEVAAPEAPPNLKTICIRAMAVDPAARYPTAQHLADALEGFALTAVSGTIARTAGGGTLLAMLFGLVASVGGIAGIARNAESTYVFSTPLVIGGAFFVFSTFLALLDARTGGRLNLAPLGYGMAGCAVLTGFIGIGFSIVLNAPDWERAAKYGGVGLALCSLFGAMALGLWGFVHYRRR